MATCNDTENTSEDHCKEAAPDVPELGFPKQDDRCVCQATLCLERAQDAVIATYSKRLIVAFSVSQRDQDAHEHAGATAGKLPYTAHTQHTHLSDAGDTHDVYTARTFMIARTRCLQACCWRSMTA